MPKEQNLYEGRRGQKRLRTIERHIQRINGEFEHNYEDTAEMSYLRDEAGWEGTSRLVFTIAQRNVHFQWSGLRDYGFIRLCRQCMAGRRIDVMDEQTVCDMLADILPAGMAGEVTEELAALEIS